MARMLGRSRSLRLLRPPRKNDHRPDAPPSGSLADRSRPCTPASASLDGRLATPDLNHRPTTSSHPSDVPKQIESKLVPIALGPGNHGFDSCVASPTPPPVVFAAEVRTADLIGVALGSPKMRPAPARFPTLDFVSAETGTAVAISSNSSPESDTKHDGAKPKLGRWKSLFGKKSSPSLAAQQQRQAAFYQLQRSPDPNRADSHHDDESLADTRDLSPASFLPDRRQTRKKSISPGQPLMRPRARTEAEMATGHPKPANRREASPRPGPKHGWRNTPSVPKVMVSNGMGSTKSHDKMMLDVDIPKSEMERYSVMFSSLLQPTAPGSLHARRQGNSERLKPLAELSVQKSGERPQDEYLKPQRRATSPSFDSGSSMSLFPPRAGDRYGKALSPRLSSLHRPRPLQRSRTEPASSPGGQRMGGRREGAEYVFHDAGQSASGDSSAEMRTPGAAVTPQSNSMFDSDADESPAVARAISGWQPGVRPAWEMLPQPCEAEQPSSSSVPTSAKHTAGGGNIGMAVSVGVARSVSVSRTGTRRDMLQPVTVRGGLTEKLVEGRALTPTLVQLKTRENRQSQQVQLVDA